MTSAFTVDRSALGRSPPPPRALLFFLASIGLAAAPAVAHAQASPVIELRHDVALELPLAGGAAVVYIGSELFKSDLAPARCGWCATNALDDGVRGALRWSDPQPARVASDLGLFVVAPGLAVGMQFAAAGADGRTGEVGLNLLFVFEALIVSGVINQATKFAVGRERPFVRALSDEEKAHTSQASDNNLSFFSGHTSSTFALAAAGGAVASLRGYRGAPFVWLGGGAVALATGYLRIAADKHYFTDVLVGALVGSAVGLVVPYVLHGPEPASAPPAASANGGANGGVAPAAIIPFTFAASF